MGRNPRLIPQGNAIDFIPPGYKCVVLITADFELAWAWRYAKSYNNPYWESLLKARKERTNIPAFLALFDKFNIPVTWLTVGHLFLDHCSSKDGRKHPEMPRPGHFRNDFWKFTGEDWYEYDPCSDYKIAPEWYCPDLVRQVINAKAGHEIGSHTFSHIDCRDAICPPELFEAEIRACEKAALDLGIEKMTSFVHPGHTIGNLDTLARLGYTSFRTDHMNMLGYPVRHPNGLYEFTTTAEFDIHAGWSDKFQVNRYISILKKAIKTQTVCYFWFHPSVSTRFINKILPPVLEFLDNNRKDIRITTTGDYVKWLNRNQS
jgi:peptidoglycan/xylan/chitin deacetylase (PgdA/CDA1 family)